MIKEMALAFNKLLGQLMPALVPVGIALGFLMPDVFIHLRPLVPWLFGLLTLAGALRLRIAEFGGTIREPLPIFAFLVSSHIIMPLVAMFAANTFFSHDPDVITGFILLFSGPTAVSGFIWVTIFRGDRALCLTLILLATLLSPIVMPGTVFVLIGARVAINIGSIAFSLILMVVIPTIIGVATNELSRGKVPELVCPYIDPISKITVLLVIAANMAPVAATIRFYDLRIWGVAALCIALSIVGFLMSKLVSLVSRCNHEKSVTLLFSCGMRNMNAGIIIAVSFFPEAAALPALLGILFQQSVAALMGKLLGRKKNQEISKN